MKRFLLMAIAVLTIGSASAQSVSKQAGNLKSRNQVEQKATLRKNFEIAGEKVGVKAVRDKSDVTFKSSVNVNKLRPAKKLSQARAASVQATYEATGTHRSTSEAEEWEMTSGTVTLDDGSSVNVLTNVIPDIFWNEGIPVEYTVNGNNIVIEPTLIASFPSEQAPTGTYYIFLEDANSNNGAITLAMDDNGGITGSYSIIYSIYPAETYNYDDWVATYDGYTGVKYNIPGVYVAPEVSFEPGNLVLFAGLGLNGYSYSNNLSFTAPFATTNFTNLTTDQATAWSWTAPVEDGDAITGTDKDFALELGNSETIENLQLVGTNKTEVSEPFIFGVGKTPEAYETCFIIPGFTESSYMLNKETPSIITRQDPDGDLTFYTNWATPDKASNSMSKIYCYHEKPAAPLYIEGVTLPLVNFTYSDDFNLHIKIQKATRTGNKVTLGDVIAEGDATTECINADFSVGLTGIEIPLYKEDEDGMSTEIDHLFLDDEFIIVIEGWDNGTFSGVLGSQDNPLADAKTSTWFEKTGEEGSMYAYTSWKTSLFVGLLGATYGYLNTEDETNLTFAEEGETKTIHIEPMFCTSDGETLLNLEEDSEIPEWIGVEFQNEVYTDDEFSFDLAITAEPLNAGSSAPRKEEAAGRTASFTVYQPGAKLDITVTQGTVTGISDVKVTKTATSGKLYNVAGQRINKDAKGIVIKDGKKILVK